MSQPLRRILVAFVFASTCALVPMATTEAAPRGGRQETFTVRTAEPRGFSLWRLLTALWQETGVRLDPNGGE